MEWYEELDFDENQLKKDTRCVGNEEILKEAYYAIMSGNMLVLEGAEGTGKTKILREVIKKFGGYGRIAYVNCAELGKELNVEDVLIKKNGILGWLFKRYPKNMVLLLDNVEHINSRNMERIKYFFDSNHLRSVIITTKDFEKLKFTESIKQRIRKIIQLHSLSDYEAVQVFRDKLGDGILSDRSIKIIYQTSNKNTQKFLNNCEHVCKVYVTNKSISDDDIKRLLERGVK